MTTWSPWSALCTLLEYQPVHSLVAAGWLEQPDELHRAAKPFLEVGDVAARYPCGWLGWRCPRRVTKIPGRELFLAECTNTTAACSSRTLTPEEVVVWHLSYTALARFVAAAFGLTGSDDVRDVMPGVVPLGDLSSTRPGSTAGYLVIPRPNREYRAVFGELLLRRPGCALFVVVPTGGRLSELDRSAAELRGIQIVALSELFQWSPQAGRAIARMSTADLVDRVDSCSPASARRAEQARRPRPYAYVIADSQPGLIPLYSDEEVDAVRQKRGAHKTFVDAVRDRARAYTTRKGIAEQAGLEPGELDMIIAYLVLHVDDGEPIRPADVPVPGCSTEGGRRQRYKTARRKVDGDQELFVMFRRSEGGAARSFRPKPNATYCFLIRATDYETMRELLRADAESAA